MKVLTFLQLGLAVMILLLIEGNLAQDCRTEIRNCDSIAITALFDPTATTERKCDKMEETMSCLRNLTTCITDVSFRIRFLQAEEALTPLGMMGCVSNLDSLFYQNVDACVGLRDICTNWYVDALKKDSRNGRMDMALGCQILDRYAACLQESSPQCGNSETEAEVEAAIAAETIRMKLKSCVFPNLPSRPAYTRQQCEIAETQCLTLKNSVPPHGQEGNSGPCAKTLSALTCIVGLGCLSDVELRLIEKREDAEVEATLGGPSTCDTTEVFPMVSPSGDPCGAGLQACLHGYVEDLLFLDAFNSTDGEATCIRLNLYVDCQVGVTACNVGKDDQGLRNATDAEKIRLGLQSCQIEAFNRATTYAGYRPTFGMILLPLALALWVRL